MTLSMPWNGPCLTLNEKWMESRRVYVNFKGTDVFLMASRACYHSFERSGDGD